MGTLRTLLFGRQGRLRSKISHGTARRLFEVRLDDLARLRLSQTSAQSTGERLRRLRRWGVDWAQISAFIGLDQTDCQRLASGTPACCSVMTAILVQSACEHFGLESWALSDDGEDLSPNDAQAATSSASTKTRSSTTWGRVSGSIGKA